MIELFLSKMVSEAPYKFTKAPWMNKIPRFLWLALRFKLATLWMAWGSGLLASRMENEEQSVQDLVVGFAIQACCSLEKKACKWKWSKNVVTRYYVLLRAYKLHKLVHATQARSRYQNTRYQATQIRRKILFSRFGDVHYWTMWYSHAIRLKSVFSAAICLPEVAFCQHNRCRHMLQFLKPDPSPAVDFRERWSISR